MNCHIFIDYNFKFDMLEAPFAYSVQGFVASYVAGIKLVLYKLSFYNTPLLRREYFKISKVRHNCIYKVIKSKRKRWVTHVASIEGSEFVSLFS